MRVLELVALGLSSREIAQRLWISRQGVTYHIGNLFVKLRASTRTGSSPERMRQVCSNRGHGLLGSESRSGRRSP